jgi:hypothetical protein
VAEEPSRAGRWSALALVAYLILALLLFASAWRSPQTRAIGGGVDTPQFMWFFRWPSFALLHGHNPLLSNYVDFPAGMNLMWNASMPLVGIVTAPVNLLLGPVFTFNLVTTLAVALSAWTAFLAIRRYVRSQVAAAIGGLVYGFSPFMLAHSLGHPHVTLAFIPPLFLIVLDEMLLRQTRPFWQNGLALGVLAAVQLALGEELLATSAIVAALGLIILIGLHPDAVRGRLAYAVRALGLAGGVFAVLAVVPLAVQFAGPQRVPGILQEQNIFVSDLLNFIVPTRMQAIAPASLTRISERFTGDVAEWTAYIGIPLILVLGFVVIRQWSRTIVRFAALLGVMLALLSLGPTLHFNGRISHIPSFVIGLAFPLLAAFLPVRVMLYTFVGGWLALIKAPVLYNILPGRLMLFAYLLVGLLLAIFIDSYVSRTGGRRWLFGAAIVVVALLPLLPHWPYDHTDATVPSYFTSDDVRQIPAGSIALVAPFSHGDEATAMLWEAASGMRFRMPEGYGFIPGPAQDPPMTATQQVMVAIQRGQLTPLVTDGLRQQILGDLRSLSVQTVIVGPMANEDRMVRLFTDVLQMPPTQTGGVYLWPSLSP